MHITYDTEGTKYVYSLTISTFFALPTKKAAGRLADLPSGGLLVVYLLQNLCLVALRSILSLSHIGLTTMGGLSAYSVGNSSAREVLLYSYLLICAYLDFSKTIL